MKNIFAAMSDDGRIARIGIEEEERIGVKSVGRTTLAYHDIDAGQLTTLIHEMSMVRKKMADKVPANIDPGAPIFRDVTRDARTIVGREHVTSREVYLALRHEGYGWLCFTFQEEPAAEMVYKMSQNIATMRPRIVTPKPPGIIT